MLELLIGKVPPRFVTRCLLQPEDEWGIITIQMRRAIDQKTVTVAWKAFMIPLHNNNQ
jgi:hypothetical protein